MKRKAFDNPSRVTGQCLCGVVTFEID